ncbi:MAG: hypothetical protein LH474_00635 [Chamaesiphon sp.]|nr:hypothetical protein [Chamaesiphon sp.]
MTSFSLNIEVTFIDELTDESLGVTQIAANNLPDIFEQDTTINLSGVDWNVLNSRPKTRAQYTKSKQLILWIQRVEEISDSDILYNLPSICKKFPEVNDRSLTGTELILAEDDWRQFEFISNTFADKVDKEIFKIQRIHDHAKDGSGWRELHMRSKPEIPISNNIALTYLASMLQVPAKSAGITYDGSQSPIKDGYSFTLNDDFSVYGIAPKGKIQVIAIGQDCNISPNENSIDLLQQLARKFNLDLVHWCRCIRVNPDDSLFRSLLSKLD